ncbi:uncharacterized protein LOC121190668 isoform X10 [Toxotes jaculatrix]|uniref:uncharacterized protein LOC121190668 isoform X10 n=1 Tax=Toxotes jaculatrix TaxID=941984 RepID=UPI001B3AC166|nr:uncharacterized protein LOC121190668 isoform X10 [Toxotes jaculatrix]
MSEEQAVVTGADNPPGNGRPVSPAPSDVSMKSDRSKGEPLNFSNVIPGPPGNGRPVSPAPSNVSMRSDRSKGEPLNFSNVTPSPPGNGRPVSPAPSNVSMKSDRSKGEPLNFSNVTPSSSGNGRPASPAPSDISMKSDRSMGEPLNFSNVIPGPPGNGRPVSPAPSDVSMRSDRSKGEPLNFSNVTPGPPGNGRPVSPAPSDVSMKSDRSKGEPLNFSNVTPSSSGNGRPASPAPSDISMKSDRSMGEPLNFSNVIPAPPGNGRPVSPAPSDVSMRSDRSKGEPLNFSNVTPSPPGNGRPVSPAPSDVSMKSDRSKGEPLNFSNVTPSSSGNGRPASPAPSNISMKSDRSRGEPLNNTEPSPVQPQRPQPSSANTKSSQSEDDPLNRNKHSEKDAKRKLRDHLKKRILSQYEVELRKHETDTELYEIKSDKNKKDEPKPLKNYNEIFKASEKERTVLMKGVPGIGKTFQTRRFMVDWAKEKANKDIDLIVSFHFSELNSKGDQSMEDLLNHFFSDTEQRLPTFDKCKVAFVLDGLEECQLPLDFENNQDLTDIKKEASMDVLLTNLIKGNLLHSACLWIISQPSGVDKIPPKYIQKVTECRESSKRREKLVSDLRKRFLTEYTHVEDINHPNQKNTEHIIRNDSTEKPDLASQRKLKSHLKEQFTRVSEGIDKQKTSALLNEIYTDLYIIEGERGEVNAQHESRQVQEAKFKPVREETPIKYHDIFKPASAENKPIRSVLTIGVAGIGKTFASMKYMLDWAEGTANENIYYTFPLPFRELNLRKENEHSLEELIHQFFPLMKTSEIKDYDKYQILIVLDGLDECRLDLNFSESMDWTDVREKTSVNVLLANLIKGNLLPKAQIWITSRPAASNNLPADKVDRVTEVRGFSDDQKEEYFRKRFSDKDLAAIILSHVKKSRSLYIMCHIPVFCWITSKVLEDFVSRNQEEGMPKTLTDMYIHFLLLQCRQANVKYGGEETSDSSETDSCLNTWNKDTILSLGKLAFDELEKGNPLFTEENLKECGIDIEKTAVFSGLFTRITREGCGLYQNNFFCFVHLSIQEFLAAFHVTYTFNNKGENLLTKPASGADLPASNIYKTAVDKALESKNGDWDLFLRFLLGLSLETNQNLLQELLQKTEYNKQRNKETVEYIKGKISEEISDADKNLNLFHCLNELNDHSLVKEVKKYLQSETQSFENFSASQWSALTYVLLISDEKLDVFDLKKYLKSEKVLLGMLPVVKVSKTTLLSWCELSEESCKGLTSSVLSSASSNLMELDLSHNDLLDSGVELLADGLKSLHCKLEILKLSGCQVTEKGCAALASALKSNTASHLKQLDLSYNHPGDKGERMLCALTEDPNAKLNTLSLDHGGAHRLKPGLKKYGADLKFDENTVSRRLVLSEGNKTVKTVKKVEEKVVRPENDDRFKRTQVFCDEGLKGLCYWEVEWRGTVGIAVSYRDVSRKWDSSGGLGCNKNSWSLICSKDGYTARHGNKSKDIKKPLCQKIALLLDWEAGTLRYYSVTTGKLSLIHTFHAKFTKPLFPGFWFKKGSVTLCELD